MPTNKATNKCLDVCEQTKMVDMNNDNILFLPLLSYELPASTKENLEKKNKLLWKFYILTLFTFESIVLYTLLHENFAAWKFRGFAVEFKKPQN